MALQEFQVTTLLTINFLRFFRWYHLELEITFSVQNIDEKSKRRWKEFIIIESRLEKVKLKYFSFQKHT